MPKRSYPKSTRFGAFTDTLAHSGLLAGFLRGLSIEAKPKR